MEIPQKACFRPSHWVDRSLVIMHIFSVGPVGLFWQLEMFFFFFQHISL